MFLLQVIELLALIGLFVQAFVAWVFVAVLASIGRREPTGSGYRSFRRAFVAMAVSLTVMSVRFFSAHDVSTPTDLWADGQPLTTASYAVYMALKAFFGLLLIHGSYELVGRSIPTWLRRTRTPIILATGAFALFVPLIDDLLLVQAPVMIGCALIAARVLRPLRQSGSGPRIVIGSLIALAITWIVHAGSVIADHWVSMRPVLSFNSFVDLGVQLMLGIGLVISLLQSTHRRLLEAEQERERLRRAIEKDEKLRALGTVVSGVAHELNNPLTVITGYADMLLDDAPTSAAAEIIGEQADRCRGIVRNLSALAGQSVHPSQRIVVEDLAQRVVRGLSPKSTAEGRHVVVEPMDGLELTADLIGVEQTLANLVVNGLQASPPGGTVTVSARAVLSGIEIRVADEGPGVPDELRERLFEPFFTTKAPGKGTGLGLSIAHAIVNGHGGRISVEDNASGTGATFCVFLPNPGAQDAAHESTLPAGAPDRLLVIDDDEAVRKIVRQQAERRGWKVHEAPTAEAALSMPLTEAGAILCDLRMPGMGGIGFHDRLAAEHSELLERVVFVTGDLASPVSARFHERCERPLLHKPFDYDTLFQRLAEVVPSDAYERIVEIPTKEPPTPTRTRGARGSYSNVGERV